MDTSATIPACLELRFSLLNPAVNMSAFPWLEILPILPPLGNWRNSLHSTRPLISPNPLLLEEENGKQWFSKEDNSWGYRNTIRLGDLHEKSKGFVMNDTLIVEAQITLVSVTKFSP
ncbi:hypothetical protein V6N13_146448 [Hibiscus sabdariffa]